MTEDLLGLEMRLPYSFAWHFSTVLGLIGAIAWAVSRLGTGRLGGGSARRPSREFLSSTLPASTEVARFGSSSARQYRGFVCWSEGR